MNALDEEATSYGYSEEWKLTKMVSRTLAYVETASRTEARAWLKRRRSISGQRRNLQHNVELQSRQNHSQNLAVRDEQTPVVRFGCRKRKLKVKKNETKGKKGKQNRKKKKKDKKRNERRKKRKH